MKIFGNRALLSKVEEEEKEGFSLVEIQDSFIYKGRVEQISELSKIKVGDIVYFAKYSPHTQDIEGMKVVRLEDIIAIA
jgi:co-chaperonin GroES (HSP10)